MFQFTGLSLLSGSTAAVSVDTGLPHSDVHESMPACGSSWLFAACHVLLRRLTPRHPPYALGSLTCFSKGHLSMSWFFPFFLILKCLLEESLSFTLFRVLDDFFF